MITATLPPTCRVRSPSQRAARLQSATAAGLTAGASTRIWRTPPHAGAVWVQRQAPPRFWAPAVAAAVPKGQGGRRHRQPVRGPSLRRLDHGAVERHRAGQSRLPRCGSRQLRAPACPSSPSSGPDPVRAQTAAFMAAAVPVMVAVGRRRPRLSWQALPAVSRLPTGRARCVNTSWRWNGYSSCSPPRLTTAAGPLPGREPGAVRAAAARLIGWCGGVSAHPLPGRRRKE